MTEDQEFNIEETKSGVKKKGNWKDVSLFGREVEEALENSEVRDESVEEFREWRPKREEAELDIKKKTVDEAAVKENKFEKKSEGFKKDLQKTNQNVAKAGIKAAELKNPDEELVEASDGILTIVVSEITRIFRLIEKVVYSRIMLRGDRFYFDAEDMSASMKKNSRGYEMEINLNEEESREGVQKELSEK